MAIEKGIAGFGLQSIRLKQLHYLSATPSPSFEALTEIFLWPSRLCCGNFARSNDFFLSFVLCRAGLCPQCLPVVLASGLFTGCHIVSALLLGWLFAVWSELQKHMMDPTVPGLEKNSRQRNLQPFIQFNRSSVTLPLSHNIKFLTRRPSHIFTAQPRNSASHILMALSLIALRPV